MRHHPHRKVQGDAEGDLILLHVEVVGGDHLDQVGEEQTDDGSEYLADVGADLLGLEGGAFEEECLELSGFLLDSGGSWRG